MSTFTPGEWPSPEQTEALARAIDKGIVNEYERLASDGPIGEGTTTFDSLVAVHPWLGVLLKEKDRTIDALLWLLKEGYEVSLRENGRYGLLLAGACFLSDATIVDLVDFVDRNSH